MNNETYSAVLAAHRSFPEPRTLLADDDIAPALKGEKGIACLSQLGLAPEELWAVRSAGRMNLVVLSASRSAREMFRVLSLAERLVSPAGKILILPLSEDVRMEATEIFCGVHPEWSRRQIEGNVVELWRAKVPLKAFADGRIVDIGAAAEMLGPAAVEAMSGTFGPPILGRSMKLDSSKEIGKPAQDSRRVVSLSVFGDSRFGTDFWKQMPEFVITYVLAHHALFPGYELHIHHDEHLYHANGGDVLLGLARRSLIKLVYVPSRPGQGKCERMLHRLAPAWDSGVEIVVCRDVDSIPTWRDRCAVEEWIASGRDMHTIHDAWAHMGVMGGLCAFRASALRSKAPSLQEFIAAAGNDDAQWATHGADQHYLNRLVLAGAFTVMGHSLRVEDRDRSDAMGPIPFVTEIAVPSKAVEDSVSLAVREHSDSLAAYMGVAGFDTARAHAFYDEHSPIAEAVSEIDGGRVDLHQRAVIGCDLNVNYSFFLPLCCLMWRRQGYVPLLFLVGDPAEWLDNPQHRLEVERSREAGAEIYWVGNFEGARSSTVAQCSRIFAAAAPGVQDEDLIMTSDADMLPIGSWVGDGVDDGIDDSGNALHIFYANAYEGSDYEHYPMCYLAAKAKVWRQIVGQDSLHDGLTRVLDDAPEDSTGAWNWDEKWLGGAIFAWKVIGGDVRRVDRQFVKGEWRLDRFEWDRSVAILETTLDGIADAHLPRPGFGENWSRIRPVLALALTRDELTWLDAYHEAWMES